MKRLKALESRRTRCSSFSFSYVPKRLGYITLMGTGKHSSFMVAYFPAGRAFSNHTGHRGLSERTRKPIALIWTEATKGKAMLMPVTAKGSPGACWSSGLNDKVKKSRIRKLLIGRISIYVATGKIFLMPQS